MKNEGNERCEFAMVLFFFFFFAYPLCQGLGIAFLFFLKSVLM